jgi:PAT family beta-lactamase induction signal transducer AmpG
VTTPSYLDVFRDRRITVILFLGFSSGLPIALSGGTLQAWLAASAIDIKTIGLLTLVGLPYTVKFLWAPLMDRFVPRLLGRRRGWVALCQLMVFATLLLMGGLSPSQSVLALALLALVLAFFSASQDIAFDAYRTDVLDEKRRGAGAAVSVLGYRLAMLTSGALALILADHYGWHLTYWAMAALMLAAVGATIAAPEPDHDVRPPRSLTEAVARPFIEYFRRDQAVALLVLVVLYKLGDAFAVSLSTTFLLRGVGLSLSEIGVINKGLALVATILGALVGGGLMAKLGLFRSLLLFGVLQAVSNLTYCILALAGKSYALVVAAVGLDNLAGGMGTAAFVALLMSLCDRRYTATQFALLSAASSVGRVFVGPPSGIMVDSLGWAPFFFATFLIALPGLALLWWLRAALPADPQPAS